VKLICGDCFANSAIRLCFVDTLFTARCLRRISQRRFHDSTPRFPPSGRLGQSSPISSVLSRRSDFLPFFPRRFVAFARRYHVSTRLLSFLPMSSCAKHRAWGFGYRFPRAIFADMETTGSLKLPGDLDCLCAHVPGLRQVETTLANNASLARSPLPARRRHPQLELFRSSIVWHLDSLFTLVCWINVKLELGFAGVRRTLSTLRFDLFAKIVPSSL
jgi:hypothetical protein